MSDTDRFDYKDGLRLVAGLAWLGALAYQPRLTLAVTLLFIGGAFMLFNASVFVRSVFGRGEGPSVAPIFGGVFAAIGVALLPIDGAWYWAWIPLFLDWGGLPMFLVGGVRVLWARMTGRAHANRW